MKFDSSKWDVENILGMEASKKLALQPDFQRFYIWTISKERSFIDSILRGYPIPNIWIWSHKGRAGKTIYDVIDGQQRLTCIRRFINNEFSFKANVPVPNGLDLAYLEDAYFDKIPDGAEGQILDEGERNKILDYMIPYVSVETDDKPQIIDIFRRLNISATNLNPQELRNAFFNGDFKTAIYKLAGKLQEDAFWGETRRVFARPTSDRMANQQFISELFVAILENEPQDKSKKVDEYYEDYDDKFRAKANVTKRREQATALIKEICRANSRYTTNTSDFYSLFLIMDQLLRDKSVLMDDSNKTVLRDSLSTFSDEYDLYNERRRNGDVEGGVIEVYRETIVGRPSNNRTHTLRKSSVESKV